MSVQEICLPEELTIKTVAEVKSQLGLALDGAGPIQIQASAVSRIDALGVQLLLVFVQAMQARQRAFSWHQPSESLAGACATLGVELSQLESANNGSL